MAQWMRYAMAEKGQEELPGPANNPRIVEYHAATSLGPSDDETPWCASYVNWCLEQSGIAGTNSPAARSFLRWGKEVKTPEWGCIVVLSRGESTWQGHVGFYVGEDDDSVMLLGGNQSNAVSEQMYPKDKILGYRMPKRVVDSKTIIAAATGSVTIAAATIAEVSSSLDKIEELTKPIAFDWKPYAIAAVALLVGAFVIYERLKKLKFYQI